MFLIKEKPHNVVEKPTHRAGNKMWENWMEKEMEIFPNFILEKKQKSTIFEFIINPKNGQPILEHDRNAPNNDKRTVKENKFAYYMFTYYICTDNFVRQNILVCGQQK